jgi:hypothetical protein
MEAGGGITGKQGSKRRRLNERAWLDLFKRFDGAGLTVEAFWQREVLSRSSFNRWRSRLPVRVGAAAAAVEIHSFCYQVHYLWEWMKTGGVLRFEVRLQRMTTSGGQYGSAVDDLRAASGNGRLHRSRHRGTASQGRHRC